MAATKRFGFWIQEGEAYANFNTPQNFFNQMFLSPPYPSSLDVMILDSIHQDETAGVVPGSPGSSTANAISFWGQVAQLAEAYDIQMIFEIAFDPTSTTYGLDAVQTVVAALSKYSSVYGLGIEGEFTRPASALTPAVIQSASDIVTATGKQFVSYYLNTPIGHTTRHTNFPCQGDQVATLSLADPNTIGIDSGYYDNFPFPSTFTCPIGPNDVANGALTNEPQGWDQCVVSSEFAAAVAMPPATRQFVFFAVGFDEPGNQLWQSATLRGWIASDPNYQADFVLATNAPPPPGQLPTTLTLSAKPA